MTDHALPQADALPAPMVTRPQWLCWRAEDRDGKTTKVPINPSSGSYASTTNSATWTDFATARDYAELEDIGIGFVFTDDDPLVGVDLDDCRDLKGGALTEWADDIVTQLDSFTEVSPSETGAHVIVKGSLPEGRNRHGDVELYETARFFTVTGDQLDWTPETVEHRTDELAAVHTEYLTPDTEQEHHPESGREDTTRHCSESHPEGNDLEDDKLLEKARNAANGEKFDRLYRGSTAGYESQSEADMALCSLLAFWTGGDAHQMDRLFRDSELYREKWDEVHFSDGATYGERTLERAIAGTQEFYGEGRQWSLFPEQQSQAATDTSSPTAAQPSDSTDVPTIEALEAEIRRLEAENERLSDELAAEREQRETLEAELAEREERGLFNWLRR